MKKKKQTAYKEKMIDNLTASRINVSPIHVKHSELGRTASNSAYRSECPMCEVGLLLVMRDDETFKLKAEDRCLLCGQKFVYDDIDEMREKDFVK